MRISLRWTTMPISDKGATFAFEAKITRHEFLQLIGTTSKVNHQLSNSLLPSQLLWEANLRSC